MSAINWKPYAGSSGWWQRATMPKQDPMSGGQASRWAWLQGDADRRRERKEYRGKGKPPGKVRPKGKSKGKSSIPAAA